MSQGRMQEERTMGNIESNGVHKILFTSVGRRVELLQAFREAEKREGISLKIYAADMSDTAPALCFGDVAVRVCRISDEDYIPQLSRICKENGIDLLIPTIDTDLLKLSRARADFERDGTRILISAPDKIALCRDKRLTYDFFRECGLRAPETFDSVDNYDLSFPCFVKPRDGSSSINAFRADSPEELREIAKRVPDYIIQPFIEGEEYTVDIFCDLDGNPVFITPRVRVAVRSGEVLQTRIAGDDVIVAECRRIIEAFEPCGPITVQLIREKKSGCDHYIEINPRYGGGAPLSMKAGADSARSVLRILAGRTTAYQERAAKDGRMYTRFDQSIYMDARGSRPVEIGRLTDVEPLAADKRAVVFDLDDTLYDERDYVRSGFAQIAAFLSELWVDRQGSGLYSKKAIEDRLYDAFESGEPAIDRLFEHCGCQDDALRARCLQIYREHVPDIALPQAHRDLLVRLRQSGRKLGIITDGRVDGQENKLEALGLKDLVDEYIVTDSLAGRADVRLFRKPNPLAFHVIRERFGVSFEDMIYVGDNIRKDFQAPSSLGMTAVWYHNEHGIYSGER